ncbi:peroxisomal leader peptide-processing protease-like isoform X2 [Daktulosphaira vitifoliae]|uniref:peroxisomal leader peptide-processing protease-like isoform X2 n=1 Tax=Daktulosphaira vitifoliae TaxID=58002 RepID=UPI0021AA5FE5|nr:peroxisomal leader peptide-processing protease-like isoform X2 [Daktulosphaira vitifoliae]
MHKSVIKVECENNVGTAVCIHTSNTGHLFLTCAHVVKYKTGSILLRYNKQVFKGLVIYAVPKGSPYDLALISSIKSEDITASKMYCDIPLLNEEVFIVGYHSLEYEPSISVGRVYRIPFKSLLVTTCNVYPGFSGSPVFTKDNKLIGLLIGKLSIGSLSFVLTAAVFDQIINNYICKYDTIELKKIESNCPITNIIWENGYPNLKLCHI